MEAIQILVEGETDCNFLKVLLAHMPDLPFSPPLTSSKAWQKGASEKVPFQYTRLTDGRVLLVTTVKGWEKVGSYKMVLENRTIDGVPVSIQASAFLFDADAPTTPFGDPCNFGGHAARLARLRELCAKAASQPEIFLFPDNQRDGTFETLLLDLIPEARRREFIDGCWGAYCDCVKAHNAPYQPTLKHAIGQYAARFEKRAATKNQLYDSTFAEESMWNWDSPALDPLKRFLTAFLAPTR